MSNIAKMQPDMNLFLDVCFLIYFLMVLQNILQALEKPLCYVYIINRPFTLGIQAGTRTVFAPRKKFFSEA